MQYFTRQGSVRPLGNHLSCIYSTLIHRESLHQRAGVPQGGAEADSECVVGGRGLRPARADQADRPRGAAQPRHRRAAVRLRHPHHRAVSAPGRRRGPQGTDGHHHEGQGRQVARGPHRPIRLPLHRRVSAQGSQVLPARTHRRSGPVVPIGLGQPLQRQHYQPLGDVEDRHRGGAQERPDLLYVSPFGGDPIFCEPMRT